MTSQNNWTEQKIRKLKEWSHISQIYSTCHSKAQEYYHKQFNYITVAVIVCGALAAVLEGANLLASTRSIGLGVTVVLLTSTVSGLNLWLNSKNPAETAAAHDSMSKGYNRIILKIEGELTNEDAERENGVKFMADIRDNLTDLSAGGKSIPLKIWDTVNKELGGVARMGSVRKKSSSAISIKSIKKDEPQPATQVNVTEADATEVKKEDTLEITLFDPDALHAVELLEKYQTARYRSAY